MAAKKELYDMSECVICTELFTDPRALPCQHTFCLQCLVIYGRDRRPGHRMPCPVCRKEFAIPAGGLSAMPKNFFMEKLIGARKEETASNLPTACFTHKGEEIKMFCLECELPICVRCFMKSHKAHNCSDIEYAAIDGRKQVKIDTGKIDELMDKTDGVLTRFEKGKNELVNHIADIEEEINTAADKLVADVERERKRLLSEVESIGEKRVDQLETGKPEVEKHMAALKSLKEDCETLLNSGTACDVTRSANSLHQRAEELAKFDIVKHVNVCLPLLNVKFTSSSFSGVKDLVGTITEGSQSKSLKEKVSSSIGGLSRKRRSARIIVSSDERDGEEPMKDDLAEWRDVSDSELAAIDLHFVTRNATF